MPGHQDIARSFDPGRGAFCAVTKNGRPTAYPPVKRTPPNRGGVARPGKTAQDRQPVEQRQRVQDARKRLEAAQSADQARREAQG